MIGPGGISLLPMEEGKGLPVLPFQSYYGLLSRADPAQPRFAAQPGGRLPPRSNVRRAAMNSSPLSPAGERGWG